jgi:hypothetical protein
MGLIARLSSCGTIGMGCTTGLTSSGIEGIGDVGRGSKRAYVMEGV